MASSSQSVDKKAIAKIFDKAAAAYTKQAENAKTDKSRQASKKLAAFYTKIAKGFREYTGKIYSGGDAQKKISGVAERTAGYIDEYIETGKMSIPALELKKAVNTKKGFDKAAVADRLEEIAELYREADDESRAEAYNKAANALRKHKGVLVDGAAARALPGIGPTMASAINEFIRTGAIATPKNLSETPASKDKPKFTDKADLVAQIQEIAKYYIRENNERRYTYEKAVKILSGIKQPITSYDWPGNVAGIGKDPKKGTKKDILEWLRTGKIERLEELRQKYAVGDEEAVVQKFMKFFGIGEERAKAYYEQGYRNVNDLWNKKDLPFGERLGIYWRRHIRERIPRQEMDTINQMLTGRFNNAFPRSRFDLLGSYRRGAETSGDVDVLLEKGSGVTMDKAVAVVNDLIPRAPTTPKVSGPLAPSIFAKGEIQLQAMISPIEDSPSRRFDLWLVKPENYAFALLHITGSDHFNRLMRQHVKSIDPKAVLSQNGITLNGKKVIAETEHEIFDALGLEYVPPEERTDSLVELKKKEVLKELDVKMTYENANGSKLIRKTLDTLGLQAANIFDLDDYVEEFLSDDPDAETYLPNENKGVYIFVDSQFDLGEVFNVYRPYLNNKEMNIIDGVLFINDVIKLDGQLTIIKHHYLYVEDPDAEIERMTMEATMADVGNLAPKMVSSSNSSSSSSKRPSKSGTFKENEDYKTRFPRERQEILELLQSKFRKVMERHDGVVSQNKYSGTEMTTIYLIKNDYNEDRNRRKIANSIVAAVVESPDNASRILDSVKYYANGLMITITSEDGKTSHKIYVFIVSRLGNYKSAIAMNSPSNIIKESTKYLKPPEMTEEEWKDEVDRVRRESLKYLKDRFGKDEVREFDRNNDDNDDPPITLFLIDASSWKREKIHDEIGLIMDEDYDTIAGRDELTMYDESTVYLEHYDPETIHWHKIFVIKVDRNSLGSYNEKKAWQLYTEIKEMEKLRVYDEDSTPLKSFSSASEMHTGRPDGAEADDQMYREIKEFLENRGYNIVTATKDDEDDETVLNYEVSGPEWDPEEFMKSLIKTVSSYDDNLELEDNIGSKAVYSTEAIEDMFVYDVDNDKEYYVFIYNDL